MISCFRTITTALYAGSVYHVLHSYRAEYNPYPLWGLYSISAQNGKAMEDRPVDPGSIQGNRLTSFIRIKYRTRANEFCVKLSINNHIVALAHKNHRLPHYTNVSDVPRSLQRWVSTIQTVVPTADVFQLFLYRYHCVQSIPGTGYRFSEVFHLRAIVGE